MSNFRAQLKTTCTTFVILIKDCFGGHISLKVGYGGPHESEFSKQEAN